MAQPTVPSDSYIESTYELQLTPGTSSTAELIPTMEDSTQSTLKSASRLGLDEIEANENVHPFRGSSATERTSRSEPATEVILQLSRELDGVLEQLPASRGSDNTMNGVGTEIEMEILPHCSSYSANHSVFDRDSICDPPTPTAFESTCNLIPAASDGLECTNVVKRDQQTSDSSYKDIQQPFAYSTSTAKPLPNFKPFVLRWPFLTILLVYICGFIGFLEYQVHTLPQPHFEMLDVPDKKFTLTILVNSSMMGQTSNDDATSAVVARSKLVPDPKPDPRPPISSYALPINKPPQYCAWGAPYWTIGSSKNNRYSNIDAHYLLVYPFYIVDDPSWCPCTLAAFTGPSDTDLRLQFTAIDLDYPIFDNFNWLLILNDIILSPDKSCQSILNVIKNLNYVTWGVVNMESADWTFSSETVTTSILPTLSPGLSLSLNLPSTGPGGQLFVPLELAQLRNTFVYPGMEFHSPSFMHAWNVFGDPLQSPFTGIFPALNYDGLLSDQLTTSYWDNNASTFKVFEHSHVFQPRSITWWPMPLTRPTATSEISLTSSDLDLELSTASPFPGMTTHVPISTPNPILKSSETLQPSQSLAITHPRSTGIWTGPLPVSPSSKGSSLTNSNKASMDQALPSRQSVRSSSITSINLPAETVATSTDTVSNEFIAPSIFTNQASAASLAEKNSALTTVITTIGGHLPHGQGPVPPADQDAYQLRGETDYLRVSLIPPLLATILSALLQITVSTVNQMLPFRALAHLKGAMITDSLTLDRGGLLGHTRSIRYIWGAGDLLPFLNTILLLCASTLIPLSTETVQLEKVDHICPLPSCPTGLRNSAKPSRGTEALLILMAALLIGIYSLRWRSGVIASPWSIAALAALLPLRSKVRDRLLSLPAYVDGLYISSSQIEDIFKCDRLCLTDYGVDMTGCEEDQGAIRLTKNDPPERLPKKSKSSISRFHLLKQHILIRCITIILLVGLVILILCYESIVVDKPVPGTFEAFMDSQKFGVRFLFATIGVAITGFWDFYFSVISVTQHYRRLSSQPRLAKDSILLSPSTTVFSGLVQAVRTKDPFFSAVALADLFAKFLPLFLANIPFKNTVTWKMHEASTWIVIGVLSYMIMLLLASFIVKQPYMPIEPTTIAGCLYYICDSPMLKDFEGLSTMSPAERERLISKMGKKYSFGEITGSSGTKRIGVKVDGSIYPSQERD